ncbi:MAG: NUDIX domain-containing protein [Myxococcota bacterium]|nr:NUDIX domain-containing protein [Myxococcota bacterium]
MGRTLMDNRHIVRQVLADHHASDSSERDDIAFIAHFIEQHPQCFGKADPAGHITGSAFVVDDQGRILMTFHRKLQRWLQLGGHGTPTEIDPADTAMREAMEESGLTDLVFHPSTHRRPIDIDVHQIPGRSGEPAHPHLDFRYLIRTDNADGILCSHESTALGWKSKSELENMSFDPALNRALAKVWALIGAR